MYTSLANYFKFTAAAAMTCSRVHMYFKFDTIILNLNLLVSKHTITCDIDMYSGRRGVGVQGGHNEEHQREQ